VSSPEQMQILTANGIFLGPESWSVPDDLAGVEFELESHVTLEQASEKLKLASQVLGKLSLWCIVTEEAQEEVFFPIN